MKRRIGDFGEMGFRIALLFSLPLGVFGLTAKIGGYERLSLIGLAPLAVCLVRILFFTYDPESPIFNKYGRPIPKRILSLKTINIGRKKFTSLQMILSIFTLLTILILMASLINGIKELAWIGAAGLGSTLILWSLTYRFFNPREERIESAIKKDKETTFKLLLEKLEGKHGN